MTGDLPLLGFGLPVAGRWATPDTTRFVARRAEELGYASLWTFQRMLSPVGGGLEAPHRTVHDSLVALAYVAGVTDRIGLGTATMCAPFLAPTLLAKAVASLDVFSGGRVTVGLGSGWMPEEYTAARVPMARRGARLEEYLHCLTALWTQDPVEFDGKFYTVPRAHIGPKPEQRPRPPILLGGAAPAALNRAGRLAEGWISSSQHDLDDIRASVEIVRDGARQAGRDPEAVRILVRGVPDLVDDDPGRQRRPFHGTRSQVLDDLAAMRARGVTEVFFDLNLSPRAGFPDVEPAAAVAYAEDVLDAFAPAASATPAR